MSWELNLNYCQSLSAEKKEEKSAELKKAVAVSKNKNAKPSDNFTSVSFSESAIGFDVNGDGKLENNIVLVKKKETTTELLSLEEKIKNNTATQEEIKKYQELLTKQGQKDVVNSDLSKAAEVKPEEAKEAQAKLQEMMVQNLEQKINDLKNKIKSNQNTEEKTKLQEELKVIQGSLARMKEVQRIKSNDSVIASLGRVLSRIKELNSRPQLIQVGVEDMVTLGKRTNDFLDILPEASQKEVWKSIVERLETEDTSINKIFLPAMQEIHNEIVLKSISGENFNASNLVNKFEKILDNLLKGNPQLNNPIQRFHINIERKFYSEKIFELINGTKPNNFDRAKKALSAPFYKMTSSLLPQFLEKLLTADYKEISYLNKLPIERIQSVRDGLKILLANCDYKLTKLFFAYLENYLKNLDTKKLQTNDFNSQVLFPVIKEFFKQINHSESANYNLPEFWNAVSKIHFGFTGDKLNLKKLWTYLPLSIQEKVLVKTVSVPVTSVLSLTTGSLPGLFSSVLLQSIIRTTFRRNLPKQNPFPFTIGEELKKDVLIDGNSLLLNSIVNEINSQFYFISSLIPVAPIIKALTSYKISSVLDENKFLISERALQLLVEGKTEAEIIELFREANDPLKFNLLAKLKVAGLPSEIAVSFVAVIQNTALSLATRKNPLKHLSYLWEAHKEAIKFKNHLTLYFDEKRVRELFKEFDDCIKELNYEMDDWTEQKNISTEDW